MGVRSLSSGSISTGTKRSKFIDPNGIFNGYSLIRSTTLSSSATSINMATIPQGYSHLEISIVALCSSTTVYYGMQFNGDSTSGNYSYQQAAGTAGSTPLSTTQSASLGSSDQIYLLNTGNMTNPATTKAFIPEYSSTTKTKLATTTSYVVDGVQSQAYFRNGNWFSYSGINRINIVNNSGTFLAGTTVSIYGIK